MSAETKAAVTTADHKTPQGYVNCQCPRCKATTLHKVRSSLGTQWRCPVCDFYTLPSGSAEVRTR